jgi:hypothetical protein
MIPSFFSHVEKDLEFCMVGIWGGTGLICFPADSLDWVTLADLEAVVGVIVDSAHFEVICAFCGAFRYYCWLCDIIVRVGPLRRLLRRSGSTVGFLDVFLRWWPI